MINSWLNIGIKHVIPLTHSLDTVSNKSYTLDFLTVASCGFQFWVGLVFKIFLEGIFITPSTCFCLFVSETTFVYEHCKIFKHTKRCWYVQAN